ncbi:LysR family transcriptional regulator [Massilia sp. 9096]|uniref:LysR family transcriptional regulator n=1 Tax=Massilia sp. 9096 TaxID=1500894 RepID=UPI00055BE023|nr:LysR family transcriptional regulator [Massilia sp. 9096]
MAYDERMMNGLGVLGAVVDSGSFARAGVVLGISPSAVSRAISRLEERLGIRLFERTTRAVVLTEEGRALCERVMPLLAGLEEATSSASQSGAQVRGRLRVNIDPFFSRLVLGPQLGTFLERHPELQLELVNRDQLGDLVGDGFDLAVRFGTPVSSSLVARKLLDTRIVTAAAPSYIARHGRPVKPQDLADGRHVCLQFRDPHSGRLYSWEFHRGRKKVEVQTQAPLTLNDAGSLHAVCLSGYGIGQLMELGAEHLFAQGRLVDLFPDWPDERFPLYALYPSRRHLPAKAVAFLDFLSALGPA